MDENVFKLELQDRDESISSDDEQEEPLTPTRDPEDDSTSLTPLHQEFIEDRTIIADFLRSFRCRALMPQSSKVVVLDTGISMLSALQALEENDIDSAPLWESNDHDFVGMITVTDLINTILRFYDSLAPGKELQAVMSKASIRQCKSTWKKKRQSLLFLEPDDSLYEAVYTLSKYKVHRVPVIDRENQNLILYILHPTRIILFLMKVMPTKPSLFGFTLERLALGTYEKVVTCTTETKLCDVLRILNQRHYAAVPIISHDGKLVDMFYKSYLTRVPHAKLFALLDRPVTEVFPFIRRTLSVEHCICTRSNTLEMILGRMMELRIRSLAVVSEADETLLGVVALGDILRLFVV